jgi:hypothetical protein
VWLESSRGANQIVVRVLYGLSGGRDVNVHRAGHLLMPAVTTTLSWRARGLYGPMRNTVTVIYPEALSGTRSPMQVGPWSYCRPSFVEVKTRRLVLQLGTAAMYVIIALSQA